MTAGTRPAQPARSCVDRWARPAMRSRIRAVGRIVTAENRQTTPSSTATLSNRQPRRFKSGVWKMVSIYREIDISVDPEHVWDAIRDVGAVHTRLAPDFVAASSRGRSRWPAATRRAGSNAPSATCAAPFSPRAASPISTTSTLRLMTGAVALLPIGGARASRAIAGWRVLAHVPDPEPGRPV